MGNHLFPDKSAKFHVLDYTVHIVIYRVLNVFCWLITLLDTYRYFDCHDDMSYCTFTHCRSPCLFPMPATPPPVPRGRASPRSHRASTHTRCGLWCSSTRHCCAEIRSVRHRSPQSPTAGRSA